MRDATESSSNFPGSVTRLLRQLQAGTPAEREEAATAIVQRYFTRLEGLVRRRLSPRLRARVDAEDLALMTFQSFCLRMAGGKFKLDDRDDFWRLLVKMAANKTRREAAAQSAQKRDARRESSVEDEGFLSQLLDPRTPSPEETAVMVEEMSRLLDRLPDDIRIIAVWKFEGYTNEEIAAKRGYTVRTIERKVELIRKKWREDDPDLTI
jgi:RNA polymerase sigma factor (sigma-70 family)